MRNRKPPTKQRPPVNFHDDISPVDVTGCRRSFFPQWAVAALPVPSGTRIPQAPSGLPYHLMNSTTLSTTSSASLTLSPPRPPFNVSFLFSPLSSLRLSIPSSSPSSFPRNASPPSALQTIVGILSWPPPLNNPRPSNVLPSGGPGQPAWRVKVSDLHPGPCALLACFTSLPYHISMLL